MYLKEKMFLDETKKKKKNESLTLNLADTKVKFVVNKSREFLYRI